MREFNFKELDSIDFDDLCCKLQRADGEILLVNVVFLPGVNVLCCECVGRKINIKFDLNYGVSVEEVDNFSDDELLGFFKKLKIVLVSG